MRNNFCRIALLSGAMSLCLPVPALAWGPDGHDFIATVARDRLRVSDPALEAKLQDIFRNNALHFVGHDDENGASMSCNGRTLREIANWPDCIRRTREYKKKTGDFHFDDIPLCAGITPPPPPPPRNSYCRYEKCASGQLPRYVAVLKSGTGTRFDRAAALAWVIHIVGDLHQPLHAEDNGDGGGNGVKVRLDGPLIPGSSFRSGKLHGFWDTPMTVAAVGRGADAVTRIEQYITLHSGDTDWASPDPILWAGESHLIAQDAYKALNPVPGCNAGPVNDVVIPAAYAGDFAERVKGQLSRAAFRLTTALRDALS